MSDDNEGFWNEGPGPTIVRGRYRLPDPVTGEDRDWTRVTTFNQTTRDSHGLTQWRLYQLLVGLSRRPDLLRRVSVLEEDDRKAMLEIVREADAVAGTDVKANEGTAVHAALALADRGRPFPEEFAPYVHAYRAELARHGLAVVPGMVEVTVCNRDLGVIGTADRFLVDAAGRVVTGDLKSGRLDLAELEHRIQFACYGTASHYRTEDGDWREMPTGDEAVRDDVAVLLKIDLEQRSVSAYQVDLVAGRRSANLARQVREDRRTRGTLLPYVAPAPPSAPKYAAVPVPSTPAVPPPPNGERHLQVVPALGAAVVNEVRVRPDGQQVRWNGQVWVPQANTPAPDPGTMAVSGGLRDDPGNEHSVNSTTASLGDALAMQNGTVPVPTAMPDLPAPVDACPCGRQRQTRDQLKRLDKAGLQDLCRVHGVTHNLARNKDPLIDYLRDAGHVVAEAPEPQALPSAPRSDDPQEIRAPIGGSDPTDPRDEAFTRLRLGRIESAPSMAELGRIHAEVTRLGGQQAWSDRLDAAAKARAAQLEPAGSPTAPAPEGDDPFRMIADAQTQEDIGRIWSVVTLGGTQGDRWTDQIGQAAQARLLALQSAVRPPAVNPFAQTPGVTQ